VSDEKPQDQPDIEGGPTMLEVPPQIRVGIFVYFLHGDTEPHMHIQSDPEIPEVSYGEIYRLLQQSAKNVEYSIIAKRLTQELKSEAKARPQIIRP